MAMLKSPAFWAFLFIFQAVIGTFIFIQLYYHNILQILFLLFIVFPIYSVLLFILYLIIC